MHTIDQYSNCLLIFTVFGAFARKADVDISLRNSLGMSYGKYASFVEFLTQFGLYNTNRISNAYYYYIKKAPTEHSVTANIKFFYLRLFFQIYFH